MSLTIGVPKETADGETRVALTPDVARRLTGRGLGVTVEAGAGAGAHHADGDYEEAGATVVSRGEALGAEVVTVVTPPADDEIAALEDGQVLVGLLDPLGAPERIQSLAEAGVTALSMELVPRISRAQKMDTLSAMSSLAGYRAVLTAAHALPKFFPLLTTAAGTIRPAQVLVLGAGVAGLQAIATARRLGARVKGYDIRDATREEVQSLGADFVDLEADISGEGEGGYARELETDVQERQPELLRPYVAEADVVVTTALIPGRDAPILVSEAAVEDMAPGSVVIDLAAPGGGNCALTEPGETVDSGGTRVLGPLNLPAEMPVHASQLYARTVAALVEAFVGEDGQFTTDFDDEVFAGACVAHGGEVRADRVRDVLGLPVREVKGGSEEEGGDEEPGEFTAEEEGEQAIGNEEKPVATPEANFSQPDAAPSGEAASTEETDPSARRRESDPAGGEAETDAEDAGTGPGDEDAAAEDEEWRPPVS